MHQFVKYRILLVVFLVDCVVNICVRIHLVINTVVASGLHPRGQAVFLNCLRLLDCENWGTVHLAKITPEDLNLHQYYCENLKYYIVLIDFIGSSLNSVLIIYVQMNQT